MTSFWSPDSPPLRRCKDPAPAPALPPSPVIAVRPTTPRDPADGLRHKRDTAGSQG
ncbi:unnamed protein product, partial [Vitis vinifera]